MNIFPDFVDSYHIAKHWKSFIPKNLKTKEEIKSWLLENAKMSSNHNVVTFTCIDNGGFEDTITEGVKYKAIELSNGGITIKNDKGEEMRFGMMHFKMELV